LKQSRNLESSLGCVGLQAGIVDDNLDNSVPDFFGHVVTGDRDELKNDIDIPIFFFFPLLNPKLHFL